MEMKKAKINGKLTTVTSLDAYRENPDSYFLGSTAIEFDDLGVVLPVKGKYEKGVGITVGALFSRITMPSEEERPQYSVDNIIDLSNVNNIKELMKKQELVRDIEYEMLTTIESKFSPTISDDDSPAMKAMKTAVIEKELISISMLIDSVPISIMISANLVRKQYPCKCLKDFAKD